MITCARCQTENIEGSQYCDECGAILREEAASAHRTPTTGPTEEGDTPGNSHFVEPARAERRRESTEKHSAARRSSEIISPAHTAVSSGKVSAPHEVAAAPSPSADLNPALSLSGRENGPHAKLVIHRGRSVGKEFPLSEDESHIGRWDADGGIFPDVDLDSDDPEAKVSRRHARITRRGEQYYIEDLGSTNGTFLNRGRRLLPGDRQSLRDGDEVIVGKTFLRFHVLRK
ncbi:MAG TPA: FHA domain-containing protein [Pyrinomonadaceae bacterium]|nr:FHA domain-containing protein [Pyrinomonadaceae bacterium]